MERGITYIELTNMITEGRKENLIAKYGHEELINDYLTNSDIHVKTNYKYADWYLKQYYAFGSLIDRIEDGDEYLAKFDKYSKNLEKKDINQYKTYEEFVNTITQYESQRKEDESIESESVKLINNDKMIIVKPLTHKSSCKYGAGTKWCTTHRDTKYFEQYDEKGNLYYIHLKQVGSDNDFYKIAVYLSYDRSREEWFNAKDTQMRDGEIKLAKLIIGSEYMDIIYKDLQKSIEERPKPVTGDVNILKRIIDAFNEEIEEFSFTVDIEGGEFEMDFECNYDMEMFGPDSDKYLPVYFMLSDSVTGEEGNGFMSGDMIFRATERRVTVDFDIHHATGAFEWVIDKDYSFFIRNQAINVIGESIVKVIKMYAERVLFNPNTVNNLKGYGNNKYWRATNGQSSYKFTGNGALTKSFKEYMNELGPEGLGSKVDFLTKIGRIEPNDEGGYSRVGGGPIVIGGYLSTFFSSLKDAGIIEYVRQGRKYMFKQGPNYNNFIEGTLRRI